MPVSLYAVVFAVGAIFECEIGAGVVEVGDVELAADDGEGVVAGGAGSDE